MTKYENDNQTRTSNAGSTQHASGSGHSNSHRDARQESGGGTSNRGFASMDQGRQQEIASKGGKAAHEKGSAHEFSSEEAREAGRKGGQHSHSGGKNNS